MENILPKINCAFKENVMSFKRDNASDKLLRDLSFREKFDTWLEKENEKKKKEKKMIISKFSGIFKWERERRMSCSFSGNYSSSKKKTILKIHKHHSGQCQMIFLSHVKNWKSSSFSFFNRGKGRESSLTSSSSMCWYFWYFVFVSKWLNLT